MSTLDLTADEHKVRESTAPLGVRTFKDRFMARWDYLYTGLRVLATETSTDVWVITPFPGIHTVPVEDWNAADYKFKGENNYIVSGSLATALETAGYTVTGPGFSSGFSTGFEV